MSLETVTGPEQMPAAPPPVGLRAALILTEAAAERIAALLSQKTPRPEALIVSVTSKGCSGLRYDIQYLDKLSDAPRFADQVTQHGVTVVVDPKASLYILGSVMDYREDTLKSGFDFINPNEVARCGCGESFSADPKALPKDV